MTNLEININNSDSNQQFADIDKYFYYFRGVLYEKHQFLKADNLLIRSRFYYKTRGGGVTSWHNVQSISCLTA